MPRPVYVYSALIAASAALFALSAGVGAASLSDPDLRQAVLELRFSRALVAYLAGSALAVGGVLVQGLFRNPLASPEVLGTTGGANFVGKLSLLLFQALLVNDLARGVEPEMLLPIGCLIGALCALVLLLAIARTEPDTVVLLLAGFLLSSLFLSLGAFVTSLAQESWEVGRAVISFALGSVAGAGKRQAAIILPVAVLGTLAAYAWARPLDIMLSGEDEARVLGVDVDRARRWCIIWAAVLTAGAVSVGGNVGFVGLVVPHGLRRFVGVSHRALIPAAALGGGAFLLACDVLARAIPSQAEIPLGVITGLLGAPTFLWLLLRSRREALYG